MGDEQHRDTLSLQVAHDAVEIADLGLRQRSGRLVEDDHPRLLGQGTGDLDQVPLRQTQLTHRRRGREAGAHLVEHLLGLAVHRGPVDHAQARNAAEQAHRLAPDEDVLGRAQLLEHHRFLVDGDDAGGPGILRPGEPLRLTADAQLPRVGLVHAGQRLDQRGLARAVLADDRNHFAGHQVEVHALERVGRAEVLVDSAQREHRHRRRHGHQKILANCSTLLAS